MANTKEMDRFAYPLHLAEKAMGLLNVLEAEVATATGPLQQFLRALIRIVRSTAENGSPTDSLIVQFQIKNDLPQIIRSFSKAVDEGKLCRDPSVILGRTQEYFKEAIAWLQQSLAQNGTSPQLAEAAGQVADVAKTIGAISDGFMGAPQTNPSSVLLGNCDASPLPKEGLAKPVTPQELKRWVNPVLGRVGR